MVVRIRTVAFEGVDVVPVDVEVSLANGLPSFTIVGLPDKAVAESRERVRAALGAIGLGLPPKRITVNLAPADLPKEGSHFDLPIALGLMTALGVLPLEDSERYLALGELSLDGRLNPVNGVLNAALAAAAEDRGLVCPEACGPEAAWAGASGLLAPASLVALVNHVKGSQLLPAPRTRPVPPQGPQPDLAEVRGHESAKRALEIAAAGGHHLLMIGPPGSGKSMLAARLPGLLPPLSPSEALEVSLIQSVAGLLKDGTISRARPFRNPHHSASMAALIGGGHRVRPGEVSLAHRGVLFLDELPEFQRAVLDALRQPIELGRAVIARVNAHVSYPARFQLVAAMNPCRCGHLADAGRACAQAPRCAVAYQARLSGPLLDRFDLTVDVPAVAPGDLGRPAAEASAAVADRVAQARARQLQRLEALGPDGRDLRCNAEAEGRVLDAIAPLDPAGQRLIADAGDRLRLSARGYHRVLRVARTIADLAGAEQITRIHLAEALGFRRHEPVA